MASTTTWGLPLVDDSMPIAPIQGLINPIAAALDAALTDLQTTEHNAQSVAAVGNLPTSGNWYGRSVYVRSDKLMRVWNGSSWDYDGPKWTGVSYIAGTSSPGFGNDIAFLDTGVEVTLSGTIAKNSNWWQVSDILFTLPDSARPTNSTYFVAAATGQSAVSLWLSGNGVVSVKGETTDDHPTWICIDGWSYRK